MYFVILLIIGLVLCLMLPFGPIIAGGIVFALVVDQYRQTAKIHEDIQAIKNHLKLMDKEESEEYELVKQFKQLDRLNSEQMDVINRRIEAELEREKK